MLSSAQVGGVSLHMLPEFGSGIMNNIKPVFLLCAVYLFLCKKQDLSCCFLRFCEDFFSCVHSNSNQFSVGRMIAAPPSSQVGAALVYF